MCLVEFTFNLVSWTEHCVHEMRTHLYWSLFNPSGFTGSARNNNSPSKKCLKCFVLYLEHCDSWLVYRIAQLQKEANWYIEPKIFSWHIHDLVPFNTRVSMNKSLCFQKKDFELCIGEEKNINTNEYEWQHCYQTDWLTNFLLGSKPAVLIQPNQYVCNVFSWFWFWFWF